MKRNALLAAVGVLFVAGLASCSDDEEPVTLAVEASSPSPGTYAFDMPETMGGGLVEITLTNADEEPHELGLIRLTDDLTAEEFKSTILASEGGPIPDGLEGAGIGFIAPGQTVTATQELEPGTWVYFCTFGDETSHYDTGMYGTVEVEGTSGSGDLPSTDASLTAEDYTFEASGLTAGTNKVTFANDGPDEYHHAFIVPMNDGVTIDEVKAFLATEGEPEGPPPIDFESAVSTTVLAPGQEQVVDLTLDSGTYAVFCFINDKAGGPPHAFAHDMVAEVTVT